MVREMPVSEDATVTSKGQVTIPKRIRDRFGFEAGTEVTFLVRGDEVVLLPKTEEPLEQLKELRNTIRFEEDEVEEMMKESEERWSRFN